MRLVDARVADDLTGCVSPSALTFDGSPVLDTCRRRASLMLTMLLRSLPAESAGTSTDTGEAPRPF
jgi:hypothetical protein